MKSTEYTNSPEIFRRWVAITTLGAALQRRVYMLVQGEPLYCNFYTILVGPPGVGKTRAIRIGTRLLDDLQNFKRSPDSLTREKFIDLLAKAISVDIDQNGNVISQTAYACFLDELSTFIRAHDLEFMTILTAMFDSPKVWLYDTLSRGQTKIENLVLSICGGITPKSIQRNWGEGAIGMGFTARLNMVFSEEAKPINIFGAKSEVKLNDHLHDLQEIYKLSGPMHATPGASQMLQEWVSAGMPPIPADSRFAEYNPRRSIHWLKLCMACSVAESNNLIIAEHHVEQARKILLEQEKVLPLAFEHMGQNPMLEALKSIHTWMKVEYGLHKQPLPEARLRRKLLQDIPPQYIEPTLSELVNSGMAVVTLGQKGKLYVPVNTSRTHSE